MAMTKLVLTHAGDNELVYLNKEKIFAYWRSTQQNATIIVADGGAVLAVVETPDEIKKFVEKPQKSRKSRRVIR